MNRILSTICLYTLTGCVLLSNSTMIGEAKVTFEKNEIFVTNFPRHREGMNWDGNSITFPFNELDEFVYKAIQTANSQYVYITIQTTSTDKYGNISADTPITIGKIDVAESKRYTDFYHWENRIQHQSRLMFWKDKREYDEKYKLRARESFSIIPTYMPKSIR